MQKNTTIAAIACLLALIISITAPLIIKEKTSSRIHQHQTAILRPEDEVDDGTFNTHLPLLIINTGDVEIPGSPIWDMTTGEYEKDDNNEMIFSMAEDGTDTVSAQLNVIDHQDRLNRPEDQPEISTGMTIRVRGNSSRCFDKKNYYIVLNDQNGNNNDQPLLGMNAHHSWALHGPILDKTLLRNYMWYNIAGEIMDYAPNVRFCEVIINGNYQGVYVLTEMITAGNDGTRLPLTVSRKQDTFSGYLLRLDLNRSSNLNLNNFTHYTLRTKNYMEIKYPGESNLTETMKSSIEKDFSTFEKALYSYDFDNKKFGYKAYIDTESFVDYFLINELTCNYDAGWLSTYIYKSTDNLYRMCIWDFNSACDNYQEGTQTRPMHFEFQNVLWYYMLMKDGDFTDSIIDRYYYLRQNYFSEEYLNQYIDDVVEYLGPAIERNYEVWNDTFDPEKDMLIPTERNPRNYQESIEQIKTFIQERLSWMDENIESLRQYSNQSKTKKFNENAN